MTGQQLKNSILQMAVHGKLVPQDPNDEPASILLERIRKEKEQLIKDGKIKKEKNPSIIFRGADNLPYEKVGNNEPVCIADEVPFDIPDSWEWVRISSIATLVTKGTTPRGGNVAYSDDGIGFLRAENVAGLDRLDLSKLNHIDEATHTGFLKRSILEADDVLITIAGTLGRTAIVKEENLPLNANQAVAIIRLADSYSIDLRYLVYALNAPAIQDRLTAQKKITAIPNLTLEIISDCLVPIPPLNEQRRIVNQFALFVPPIAEYEDKQTELNALNANFPETLRKSILQEAVQGNLVPQDPNDEPASVLLERIRAEKQALIKAGKIKKDKNESVIFRRDNSHYEKLNGVERCIDNEIPFDVPDNWCWVRLGTISTYAQKKEKMNAKNASSNIWELDLEDIEKGGKLLKKSNVSERKAVGDKTIFYKGNILYSKLRPYLLKIFVADENGICTPEIVPFDTYCNIYNEYIATYLKSPYVDNFINTITYGVKMPRVGTETMVNLFVPLPPVEEQLRIVAAYKSILPTLEQL